MRLLIVEDDIKISSFLEKGLVEENYSVDCSYDGEEALYLILNNKYDLIVLDLMIPSLNGISLCKNLRDKGNNTPIIILTAKSTIEDKVLGLNEGANDYLTKPFSFEELLARIKVQLRTGKTLNNILQLDDLKLNLDTKTVERNGDTIEFTAKEYALLEFLLRNQNKLVTVDMINESLWNIDQNTASNIVNVYIYRVRTKIDKNHDKKLLHTIRGMGFKLSITI
ncbi:MAG: response regulator transcription factor [Campylobacterota bacterium]|nr:response regulator transcription factor [Campylobacterota bacterium]